MPGTAARKTRILFLSHDDASSGTLAAAVAASASGESLEAVAAGVHGSGVDPGAIAALAAAGIPLPSAAPTSLAAVTARGFDVLITLDEAARDVAVSDGIARPRASTEAGPEDRIPVALGFPVLVEWIAPPPSPDFGGTLSYIGERVHALLEHGFLRALVSQRRRWETLLDTLEDGVIAHDNARRIFLVNSAAERITGWTRDEILGANCQEVFGPDGLCGSRCSFCEACPEGTPVKSQTQYEISFTTRDGRDLQLGMRVVPMEIEPGRPWGVLATIRDLTEVEDLRMKVHAHRPFHGMVGASEPMREIFDTVRRISTSDYPVLVTGESGTGKELVAAAIHVESRRGAGPFVPINCGALPDNILESELFGHVRGAFTGAVRTKKGRFELADGGTIFLDEVGELSPVFQVKLLRVLDHKTFEMVGGEKTIRVDVRVVSATNRDLRAMVREGRFREDLFYRLSVVPIELPPLRTRREDIPLLAADALARIAEETGAEQRKISDEAMDVLLSYGWPGNVRELIHSLQFAALRSGGPTILPRHLPIELRGGAPAPAPAAGDEAGTSGGDRRPGRRPKLAAADVDRALAEAGGNKVRAAAILGVGRATLYRFLDSAGRTPRKQ